MCTSQWLSLGSEGDDILNKNLIRVRIASANKLAASASGEITYHRFGRCQVIWTRFLTDLVFEPDSRQNVISCVTGEVNLSNLLFVTESSVKLHLNRLQIVFKVHM